MCSQQIPSLRRASGSHSAELAGPLAVSEVPCSSEALVLSPGTLAGKVGEGPESGRGSSLELVCRGMTGGGGGTEAAGLAEVGEVAWRPAQPGKAVTPLGLIK